MNSTHPNPARESRVRGSARWIPDMLAIACAACAAPAVGAQTPTFEFSYWYGESRSVEAQDARVIGLEDVTGDRLDDLILYKNVDGKVRVVVYPQVLHDDNRYGPWGASQEIEIGEQGFTLTSGFGDFNGDGINDIAIGNGYRVDVVLADKSGFLPPRSYADEHYSTVEAVVDFDGDGHLDIMSSQNYGAGVLLGDGTGGISDRWVIPKNEYARDRKLLYADVSGDGVTDIIGRSHSASTLFQVATGDGAGGFESRVGYGWDRTDSWEGDIAAGDVDGDGRNDMLVAVRSEDGVGDGILLYGQNADGTLSFSGRISDDGGIGTRKNGWSQLLIRDLDGDGDDDLLAAFDLGRGYYLQQPGGGLPAEPTIIDPERGAAGHMVVGDANSDGCLDVVESMFHPELDGYVDLTVYAGRNCHPRRVANDFNADGHSDLLWHHAGNGANVIWESADIQTQQPVTRVTNAEWFIAATGDFDGDRVADIVWRNSATGAGTIWKSGNYWTQRALVRITDPAWQVAGVGDFDRNGISDLLWRHATSGANVIWRGGDYYDQQRVTSVNPAWNVAGVGDFDGDGRDDIFWRLGGAGRNTIWLAADSAHRQAVATVSGLWQIAGIGDFDGDGKDDAFWRHPDSGANQIWRSGSHAQRLHVPPQAEGWTLAAVADYDGNGKDDVFWRGATDGRNVIWPGAARAVQRSVATVPDALWKVSPE